MAEIITGVSEPISRVALGVQDSVIRNLGERRGTDEQHEGSH